MKIDWKSNNTRIIAVILAVIIIPIFWNKFLAICNAIKTAHLAGIPKTVQVSKPIEKTMYSKITTTGRVEAKDSINVIARVDGWLEKKYFEEGDIVKKGQKLFTIEPDEYIYAAKNAQATVNENRAVFHNSQIELKRAHALLKQDFVSQEYYDDALTTRNKNRAALDGSVAELNKARLNLSYTTITAPMSGRIGKRLVSEGNFVTASSGNLATIYTTDPMRVTFNLKSDSFIELKRYFQEHKIKKTENGPHVLLKLADGSTYEHEGKIEFIDNAIDETTGTITLRAIFPNPDEILVHGDYVNVMLKATEPEKLMTIPQSATKTDVGTGYYVWVIKDNKAEKRDVIVENSEDNMWIVNSGLTYDDDVVFKGIQDIYKTGQPVNPEPYVEEQPVQQNAENETPQEQQKISIIQKLKHKISKLIKKITSLIGHNQESKAE